MRSSVIIRLVMEAVKNLILICGDEEYLKTEKKKELFSALGCEGSPDFHMFSGKETDFEEVMDLAETMPMFSTRRILFLDDTCIFRSGSGDAWLSRMKELPDSTCMIFFEHDIDSNNAFTRLFGSAGSIFRFDSVESVRDWKSASQAKGEIRTWIRDYLGQSGKKIDSRAVEALVDLSGYNMMNLQTELEKLLSCPADPVTENTIRDICSKNVTDRVFDMVDMKLSGNTAGALHLFEEMLSIRVEPMKILYLLGKQFQQVYTIRELESRRMSDAEILTKTGLKDWQLKKLRDRSRGRSMNDLLYLIRLCVEMETKVKNGDMPDRIAAEIILCS